MSASDRNPETRIALFQRKEIRRAVHDNEWWFVVEDVVLALIDSRDAKQYIQRMKQRDPELRKGWVQIVQTLPIPTEGGSQTMLCANTEGIFRLIQSIPSPKAEPFKRWLAKVGYERIQEIENPELATKRTRALYKAKGYSDDWIEKRMRSIAIRDELTDEWKKRGVREQREYAILTAEISKATFGLTPSQYAEFKRLRRENLRDHMTDLELIFAMLGEAATTEIARNRDAQGFPQNKRAAHSGGTVAGNARLELEKESGREVVTRENYLALAQSTKKAAQLTRKAAAKRQSMNEEIKLEWGCAGLRPPLKYIGRLPVDMIWEIRFWVDEYKGKVYGAIRRFLRSGEFSGNAQPLVLEVSMLSGLIAAIEKLPKKPGADEEIELARFPREMKPGFELVARLAIYRDTLGLDLRDWVNDADYKGWTKRGSRIDYRDITKALVFLKEMRSFIASRSGSKNAAKESWGNTLAKSSDNDAKE